MEERLEKLTGEFWNLIDDLECMIQLTMDLEAYYEYEGNQESRRLVKSIGLMIGQLHDRFRHIMKIEMYNQPDSLEKNK